MQTKDFAFIVSQHYVRTFVNIIWYWIEFAVAIITFFCDFFLSPHYDARKVQSSYQRAYQNLNSLITNCAWCPPIPLVLDCIIAWNIEISCRKMCTDTKWKKHPVYSVWPVLSGFFHYFYKQILGCSVVFQLSY